MVLKRVVMVSLVVVAILVVGIQGLGVATGNMPGSASGNKGVGNGSVTQELGNPGGGNDGGLAGNKSSTLGGHASIGGNQNGNKGKKQDDNNIQGGNKGRNGVHVHIGRNGRHTYLGGIGGKSRSNYTSNIGKNLSRGNKGPINNVGHKRGILHGRNKGPIIIVPRKGGRFLHGGNRGPIIIIPRKGGIARGSNKGPIIIVPHKRRNPSGDNKGPILVPHKGGTPYGDHNFFVSDVRHKSKKNIDLSNSSHRNKSLLHKNKGGVKIGDKNKVGGGKDNNKGGNNGGNKGESKGNDKDKFGSHKGGDNGGHLNNSKNYSEKGGSNNSHGGDNGGNSNNSSGKKGPIEKDMGSDKGGGNDNSSGDKGLGNKGGDNEGSSSNSRGYKSGDKGGNRSNSNGVKGSHNGGSNNSSGDKGSDNGNNSNNSRSDKGSDKGSGDSRNESSNNHQGGDKRPGDKGNDNGKNGSNNIDPSGNNGIGNQGGSKGSNGTKPDCKKKGGICGDPKIVGGDGIIFYFYGLKNQNFCLVSDSDLHINAHFIGTHPKGSTHDNTWVQALGFVFGPHTLIIAAKSFSQWDNQVDHLEFSYNGKALNLNAMSWTSSDRAMTLSRIGTVNSIDMTIKDKMEVSLTVIPITQENNHIHKYGIPKDNCFAHFDMQFKFYNLSSFVDGVLGQTYQPGFINPVNRSLAMPIMDGLDRFVTSSLLASDCKMSQYIAKTIPSRFPRSSFTTVCGSSNLPIGIPEVIHCHHG